VQLECDEDSSPTATGVASATDNCDPSPSIGWSDALTPSTCPQEMILTRTWTAIDSNGNTSSCDQIITVVDNTPPNIECPPNLELQCDESTDPSNTGEASATDNCDPEPAITFADEVTPASCPQEMIIVRTWTATDDCDNASSCEQTITVVDTTPPDIECPPNVELGCDESTDPSNTGQATATDNCDPEPAITFADEVTPGACPPEMVITRTWTATDECGNSSSCEQIITVVDTTPPVIQCPPNVVVECGESTDPGDTGVATATDNCTDEPTVTHVDSVEGSCPTVITRTWTATDECGNASSCDQIITVEDTTPPQITCPADVTVESGGSIDPSDTGWATATDNCDDEPTVTYVDSAENGCTTIIARTWTATDGCGNESSCDQIITVGAGTPGITQLDGTVRVHGTDAGDVVRIQRVWFGRYRVFATFATPRRQYFKIADVTRFEIWTCGGNDSVFVARNVRAPVYADGGADDDYLRGGYGDDELTGGPGNDRILGYGGNDLLSGDDGDDRIWGGGGNDQLFGGNGDDRLWGNSGHDQIDGSTGDDRIWGGWGNDVLLGGDDNDQLFGGAGKDALRGGPGDDRLQGGRGPDLYVTGLGTDVLSWMERRDRVVDETTMTDLALLELLEDWTGLEL
jgi:hypothetical protein